ncbi:hypothetical protein CCR80_03065 [Rhodothalassium salexigens]|nr:LuxR family transcriptional regulator [Rhodothalassium salexigens]MBK5920019.1 hypothetical protein [Rhodothalassium salexigens]
MAKPCGAAPDALAVVDRLDAAQSREALDALALDYVRQAGFDGYYYIRYDTGVGFSSLDHRPPAWLDHYRREGLLHADPVTLRVCAEVTPFRWEEAFAGRRHDLAWMRRYLVSRDYGLAEGFNVPIHGNGFDRATFCVFGADTRRFQEALRAHRGAIKALAHSFHNAYERLHRSSPPPLTLSPREVECLHWAAEGKTNGEIADILSISANTVNAHMAGAARKLGTATRIQTVVKAITLHLILP